MMDAIVQGAMAGAIGALLGGGLAWAIERIAGKKLAWTRVLPLAGVVVVLTVWRMVPSDPRVQAMDALDQIPSVAALKAHYPADYALLKQAVTGIDLAASVLEAQNMVRPIIASVIARQMPKASPDSTYDVMQLLVDQLTVLRRVDPAVCVSMARGGTSDRDMGQVMPVELQQRDGEVMGRLLTQTATDPEPPARRLKEEELVALTVRTLERLSPENAVPTLDLLMKMPSKPTARQNELLCDYYIASFAAILALPAPVAGVRGRSFFATK
ncbi:MAG: hypothetical protein F9K30_22990 [Dechloromonas sp.]|nr:MAG: hypothetical protein F9K30_22990 [Dechloromonas sp.]